MRILEEKEEKVGGKSRKPNGKKVVRNISKYLVEFAGAGEPQWADHVTPRLLARWRVKQQCGEEKNIEEYLGLTPDNLVGAVPEGAVRRLVEEVVVNIHDKATASLIYSEHNTNCQRVRYEFTLPCDPKVCSCMCLNEGLSAAPGLRGCFPRCDPVFVAAQRLLHAGLLCPLPGGVC